MTSEPRTQNLEPGTQNPNLELGTQNLELFAHRVISAPMNPVNRLNPVKPANAVNLAHSLNLREPREPFHV